MLNSMCPLVMFSLNWPLPDPILGRPLSFVLSTSACCVLGARELQRGRQSPPLLWPSWGSREDTVQQGPGRLWAGRAGSSGYQGAGFRMSRAFPGEMSWQVAPRWAHLICSVLFIPTGHPAQYPFLCSQLLSPLGFSYSLLLGFLPASGPRGGKRRPWELEEACCSPARGGDTK